MRSTDKRHEFNGQTMDTYEMEPTGSKTMTKRKTGTNYFFIGFECTNRQDIEF